ncbi:hypothetical protein Ancab_018964 [Ancistrocladus abbreviatus]
MGENTRRKWEFNEDVALVSCMIDFHNIGTYNAESGFKPGIKTLKRDWSIIYYMVYGKNTSGFGWDDNRKMVVAEAHVWDAYVAVHREAIPFRKKAFPHFIDLCLIYAKDRATGVNAQTVDDVFEEIQQEEANQQESINEEIGPESREEGTSHTQSRCKEKNIESSSNRKRQKINDDDVVTSKCILNAAMMLGNDIKEASKILGASEHVIQEKVAELDKFLSEVEGLSTREWTLASIKLPDHPRQMLVFFSHPPT